MPRSLNDIEAEIVAERDELAKAATDPAIFFDDWINAHYDRLRAEAEPYIAIAKANRVRKLAELKAELDRAVDALAVSIATVAA